MKRKSLIAVGALVAVAAAAFFLSPLGQGVWRASEGANAAEAAAPAKPPPPVEVAPARAIESQTEIESVGALASDESVSVATEVPGRISEIAFKEGEPVKAGDVLIKLDIALARADVANAEAAYRLAQSNFSRANMLSESGAGTQRAKDEAKAALDTSAAALELARVRLDKMEIRAPFDGVVGLRSVSVGAYAQIGQALVNLEKIDTLKLDFRLPEINLRDVQVGQKVEVRVDAFPKQVFEASVYAIDPLVDANGRALHIRARLENPGNVLRPGLFARVKLQGASRGTVVTVPESAIVPRGTDTIVFTIKDGKAVVTKVKTGRRKAGEVEIVEGLASDATVVVAGQQRLRDGQTVEIVTAQRPS